MKTLKFKTNINCGSCLRTVTPFIENLKGISEWKVNTEHRDKILEVVTEEVTQEEVMSAVTSAGFKIEPV